jgi:peptide/nickel transport system permease protein
MYYIKRISEFLITLFLITVITFCVFQILPGDPALAMLGVDADTVQIENLHRALGLDKPVIQRYVDWLKGVCSGNLGISFRYRQSVSAIVASAFSVTVTLSAFVLMMTVIIGIPVGAWLALHDCSPASIPITVFAQAGVSIPSFCVALFFIFLFSVKFQLFPSMGYVPWSESPSGCIRSLFLPALSISFGTVAVLIRYMRASVLSQLKQDYVRTARSRGLTRSHVLFFHVLRNSLIPVVTVLGMLSADVLGGSIIVENVFSLPGIGKLLASSISSRDFPLLQGLVLYISIIVVICNFVVDMLYTVIDPRIRIQPGKAES